MQSNATLPPPLVLEGLREHFRRAYLLNENQVESMLVSSAKSLRQALASAGDILDGKEPETGYTMVFHGLKGLLLNMGEQQWAAYTMRIEDRLKDGERLNVAAAIETIEQGLAEILKYGAGEAP